MCKVILGLVGLIVGIIAGGAGEMFLTVVFPHGGWGHVSGSMRSGLLAWSLLGGGIGVAAGAKFDFGRRNKEGKFYYAGALLVLGMFWCCIASLVLPEAPLLMHLLSAAPYFLLAVLVIVVKQAGLAYWFAAIPTLAFSFWLHEYAYPVWLYQSARYYFLYLQMYDYEQQSLQKPNALAILIWPFIGIGVMLASVALGKILER